MAVQITNLSTSQIRIVVDAGTGTITYDIFKKYCFLLQPGEPVLTILWHQYELTTHQKKLDVDFNDVTVPVCVSAANLATQVQAFIDTIYSGGGSFDPTSYSGWDANNPDLILQPVGDGSTNLIWRQSA